MCVVPCLSESAKDFAEEPFALQLSDKALQDVTLAYNSLASGLFFLSTCALESTPFKRSYSILRMRRCNPSCQVAPVTATRRFVSLRVNVCTSLMT
jgi:hypothetical protein